MGKHYTKPEDLKEIEAELKGSSDRNKKIAEIVEKDVQDHLKAVDKDNSGDFNLEEYIHYAKYADGDPNEKCESDTGGKAIGTWQRAMCATAMVAVQER